MIDSSDLKQMGIPPECAGGLKISLWNDDYIEVENHNGIEDMKDKCIKFHSGKRVVCVKGEKLTIKELNGNNIRIKGKILSIEYLT